MIINKKVHGIACEIRNIMLILVTKILRFLLRYIKVFQTVYQISRYYTKVATEIFSNRLKSLGCSIDPVYFWVSYRLLELLTL